MPGTRRRAERYERRSLLITSNLVFSQWERIFKNPMTTAAAIDRLVRTGAPEQVPAENFGVALLLLSLRRCQTWNGPDGIYEGRLVFP